MHGNINRPFLTVFNNSQAHQLILIPGKSLPELAPLIALFLHTGATPDNMDTGIS